MLSRFAQEPDFAQEPNLISQGQGDPALVFLHYFSGSAASWQWVTENLKQEFRCIALDLPGFGDAPPLAEPSLENYSSFIWDTIARLGLTRFVLIGHSMGGKIALHAAANSMGEGLEQVILIAPSPATQEPMPDEERDRLLTNHRAVDTAETTVKGAAHKNLTDLRQAVAVRTHTKAEGKTWRWWLLKGMNNSIAHQMGQVKVPVTVLASQDDPVIPLDAIRTDVVDLIDSAKLVETAGVGHLIPLENPQCVADTIRAQVAAGRA